MRIGIPRALFYYLYYPMWKCFFEMLDQRVILSSPTNKTILSRGIEFTVDDACLPVKIYHGHVSDLVGKADAIYIPRIISIKTKEYICPKFLGLPDMIRSNIPGLPEIIDLELNLYDGSLAQWKHFQELGRILGKKNGEVLRAYISASRRQNNFLKTLKRNKVTPPDVFADIEAKKPTVKSFKSVGDSDYKILVLGHPYNIHDEYLSLGLIKKLKKSNATVITYEMLEDKHITSGANQLPKKMFWTLGKNILGACHHYLDNSQVDGIISVASFGCGPDSLVGELLERKVQRDYDIPFLYLNIDEQSGEAGFNTRLEAFLDILEGRKRYEGNLSTHG